MIGEKMGTMTAKVVNKVNPANNGLPSFESSTEGSGTLVGVEVQQMSTYKAEMLPSGSMYGECPNSGVVMAKDGIATFRATGAGSFTEDGGSKFRGCCYFETTAASLMAVNGKCMAYEWDVDSEGTATWNLWEWM